jgi:hypothetical protein
MSRKHLPAAVLVSIGCSVAFERCALPTDRPDDALQVADTAGEPVNAGDHKHVALAKEVEHRPQFLTACRRGAAALLGTDQIAASHPQRAAS